MGGYTNPTKQILVTPICINKGKGTKKREGSSDLTNNTASVPVL